MSRIVAIVGRPNVGKSRLFNRLVRRRVSIVHDQPGVTRDVISAEVEDGSYELLDTGGLGLVGGESTAALTKASEKQVDFAMAAAGLILFVVDGIDGITALDVRIAQMLRRGGKPVLLVVNKADFHDEKLEFDDIYRLGFGEPLIVSAEHGRGESALRKAILDNLGPIKDEAGPREDAPLCICFVGRPNVGKSSLGNRLLKSNRLIVSDVPGTTRDAIQQEFNFEGRDGKSHVIRLIDTAGIKASTKLASPVEYFSRLRSIDSIRQTDIVFLVLDAMEGVTQQDKAIAGEALKEHKPIIVIVNKWDLVLKQFQEAGGIEGFRDERDYREKYEKSLSRELFFTPGSPVIFVSAQSGYEIPRMLNAALRTNRLLDSRIPTARLNRVISFLTERTPPPSVGGKRFRAYYATQTGNRPFRIRIFCNYKEKLTEQYRRYLESGIIKEFDLGGCPFYFDLVGKPKHTAGTPYTSKNTLERKRLSRWQAQEMSEEEETILPED